MKIIKSSYEILTPVESNNILTLIEKIARTCYKSEDKITEDSAEKMIKNLIKNGHEAMIEHFNISVKFICDRGVSHELVRHRIASYAQESTRYVSYNKDKFGKELTFIEPVEYSSWSQENKLIWQSAMKTSEEYYMRLVENGLSPQNARGVLPIDIKTEINITCNLREWRTIFKLRCASAAHPNIRKIMISLLEEMHQKLPVVFEDLWLQYCNTGVSLNA